MGVVYWPQRPLNNFQMPASAPISCVRFSRMARLLCVTSVSSSELGESVTPLLKVTGPKETPEQVSGLQKVLKTTGEPPPPAYNRLSCPVTYSLLNCCDGADPPLSACRMEFVFCTVPTGLLALTP